ncbi:beta/gamma crystallin domain-containing protein [Nonomuraea longicatena]|uniref:Streptomyces killer toxin-like beta/gamma crystallin domain-containing protein n=1 Tax=Nonomuraea longicatena TaxID=83682 RepID=A0ABN1Q049_9ACTN
MKLALPKILTASAVALAALVTFAATPAHAINKVHCRSDGGFLWINNGSAEQDNHCFANRGTVNVAIYGTYVIWAGNNDVAVSYIDDLGGPEVFMLLGRGDSWHYDSPGQDRIHKITRLQIL